MDRMYCAAYHSRHGLGAPVGLSLLGDPAGYFEDAAALARMANADDPSVRFFVVYNDDGDPRDEAQWKELMAPGSQEKQQ